MFSKFLFEEFVRMIFPSFSLSSNRTVCFTSGTQNWVPFSNLTQPSFTLPCFDSQCHFPLHFFLCSVSASNLCVTLFFHCIFREFFLLCIQSIFSPITTVSIFLSESSSNETSQSTSFRVRVPWPCPLSSSMLHISLMSFSPFLLWAQYLLVKIFLYFLFVWMMSRSIFSRRLNHSFVFLLGAHVRAV